MNIKIKEHFTLDIDTPLQVFSDVIDYKTSKETKRIAILYGVNEELDNAKEIYEGLENFLV